MFVKETKWKKPKTKETAIEKEHIEGIVANGQCGFISC